MRILVINPNSDERMTKNIQKSLDLYFDSDLIVRCFSTPEAPEFIENYEDEYKSGNGMIKLMRENMHNYDAFVIACHCDPNLDLLKEISDKPVVGIAEASMKLATFLGHRFSVISTDAHSTPNKQALARKYHLEQLLASVRVPENITDLEDPEPFYKEACRAIEEDGAEVIVLGCSGLTAIRENLQNRLKAPVLDSVICGVIAASGFVRHGVSISKVRRYCPAVQRELEDDSYGR